MWNFVLTHQLGVGAVAMWLLSSAMPTPKDGSSAGYTWLFSFAQTIGGAIPRLLAIYAPSTLKAVTGQTPKATMPQDPPLSQPQIERSDVNIKETK